MMMLSIMTKLYSCLVVLVLLPGAGQCFTGTTTQLLHLPSSATRLPAPSSSSPAAQAPQHTPYWFRRRAGSQASVVSLSREANEENKVEVDNDDEVVDVVVIGSGLAGLSCAALLAHCGRNVLVLESHDTPGGAAHTWERRGFHFESGPSLYSGLSASDSPNPLKNVFQIVGEDCEWITYDRWGTVMPNGDKFAAKIGPDEFGAVLRQQGGQDAEIEFGRLMERMKPLSDAAQALTSLALREDAGVAATLLFRYPRELFQTLAQGQQLNEPFSNIMDEMNIQSPFVKNWLDMLCFLLQGLPAAGTMNAVMAYMLADWYRPGVTLDYPKGGSGSIVDALVRAIRKNQSQVQLNSHVEEILVDNDRAVGVRLAQGRRIRAKEAVVSNADPYITKQLLEPARRHNKLSDDMVKFLDDVLGGSAEDEAGKPSDLKSFIHLHAGIDATGLPDIPSESFPAQWAVVRNWEAGVEAPRNIVLCSMPSLIDPSMAPEGKHVLHAYTPATEPCAYLRRKQVLSEFWSCTITHNLFLSGQTSGGTEWTANPKNTRRKSKRRQIFSGAALRSTSPMRDSGWFQGRNKSGRHSRTSASCDGRGAAMDPAWMWERGKRCHRTRRL